MAMLCTASALPHAARGDAEAAGWALKNYGAVLIKTTGQVVSADEFKQLAVAAWQAAGHPSSTQEYNGPGSVNRAEIYEGVYDVNAGRTNTMPVPPHSEQSYLFLVPRFVAFSCWEQAKSGGHLELFDNAKIVQALPDFTAKLRAYNVTYQRVLGDRTKGNWSYATGHWQTKYGTSSFAEAQKKAAEDTILGGPAGSTLKPHLQDTALMEWTVPAVSDGYMLNAILDNQRSFNENDGLAPFHSQFGNGEEFSSKDLEALRRSTQEALTHQILMEPGDVVVLDNWRWAHGRQPYEGKRVHGSVISDRRPVHGIF
ncbi:unnamed protein product [Symbiodinium sp. CCMP2456]|nr:unnamed protein product [Symbiodinium sp. CCMP2456]